MEELMTPGPELRAVSALFGLTLGVVLNRKIGRAFKRHSYKKMGVYFDVSLPVAVAYNGYTLYKAAQELAAA